MPHSHRNVPDASEAPEASFRRKAMPSPALARLQALLTAAALTGLASSAWALDPKTPRSPELEAAQARYESDKKLCKDESDSNARLQCRRDAQAAYDKSLADIQAKAEAARPAPETAQAGMRPTACEDCGKVVAIAITEKEGDGNALGMIAGGAAGALLGHQVGGGTGRKIAAVAGAVGGAYAGKKIQGKMQTHKVWGVNVEFPDGSRSHFEFDHDPGFKVGDAVKKSGNSIAR